MRLLPRLIARVGRRAGAVLAVLALVGVTSACGGTGGSSGPPPSAANSTIPASTDQVEVRPNIAYYPGGPTLDAYLPRDGRTGRPAVVMVHGGGWSQGDKTELAPWAMQAATEQGWAAFSVDYTLDGQDPQAWPDQLHQVQAAIRHVAANADTYGVDPDQIVLLGGSAGANLVALISTYGTADPVTGSPVGDDQGLTVRINAVALWSPPVDLAALVPGTGKPPPGCDGDKACDFIWSSPAIVTYLGCEPAACPDTYRQASPLEVVSTATAPTFVANSADELVPIDQIKAYVAALRKASVPVQLDERPGRLHSYQYGDEVWSAAVAFLAQHLSASAAAPGGTAPAGG